VKVNEKIIWIRNCSYRRVFTAVRISLKEATSATNHSSCDRIEGDFRKDYVLIMNSEIENFEQWKLTDYAEFLEIKNIWN